MYKVIIVDDEKNIRDRLMNFFPWADFNMTVVGAARNGLEALSLIEKLEPDLVLTDIKMPKMDGIALSEQITEHFPNVITVFISSYADFELAQQAINNQVQGYLLKPIMQSDFTSFMTKLFATNDWDLKQSTVIEALVETEEAAPKSTASINDEKYIDFAKQYIQENYAENITIKDVAEQLYIHESYFSKKFNELMGENFNTYVNRVRIEHAKHYLKYTNYPLKEIAYLIGFSSNSYFTRVFTKNVGTSPMKFRNKTKDTGAAND